MSARCFRLRCSFLLHSVVQCQVIFAYLTLAQNHPHLCVKPPDLWLFCSLMAGLAFLCLSSAVSSSDFNWPTTKCCCFHSVNNRLKVESSVIYLWMSPSNCYGLLKCLFLFATLSSWSNICCSPHVGGGISLTVFFPLFRTRLGRARFSKVQTGSKVLPSGLLRPLWLPWGQLPYRPNHHYKTPKSFVIHPRSSPCSSLKPPWSGLRLSDPETKKCWGHCIHTVGPHCLSYLHLPWSETKA